MALLATWIAPTTKEKGLHTSDHPKNILNKVTQIDPPSTTHQVAKRINLLDQRQQ